MITAAVLRGRNPKWPVAILLLAGGLYSGYYHLPCCVPLLFVSILIAVSD